MLLFKMILVTLTMYPPPHFSFTLDLGKLAPTLPLQTPFAVCLMK